MDNDVQQLCDFCLELVTANTFQKVIGKPLATAASWIDDMFGHSQGILISMIFGVSFISA